MVCLNASLFSWFNLIQREEKEEKEACQFLPYAKAACHCWTRVSSGMAGIQELGVFGLVPPAGCGLPPIMAACGAKGIPLRIF